MIGIFLTAATVLPSSLQQDLQKISSQSDGRIGICVLEVKSNYPVCINGDQKFSLQSVMKLFVAAAVMDKVDRKQMKLSDTYLVKPEDARPGPQDFANLVKKEGGRKTSVEELITLAVNDSDSTSVDFLIERIGGIAKVQEFFKRKKIKGIRIDRTEGDLQSETSGLTWKPEYSDEKKFEAAVKALPDDKRDNAWNTYLKDSRDTATPEGSVNFLKALASGKLLSVFSTNWLLALMEKTTTGRDRLKAGTPADWKLGHKTGTSPSWKGMAAAINDIGILTSPKGEQIAIAVFVAESKRTGAERAAVISGTAKAVTGVK